MRLIDADELQRYHIEMTDNAGYVWPNDIVFCKHIDDAHTIDLVTHGHWIDLSSPDHIIKGATYKCFECGEMGFYPSKFCSNCGAMMDGD